jgi:hypothetical protein
MYNKARIVPAIMFLVLLATPCYAGNEVFSMMGAYVGGTTRIVTTNSSALLSTVYDAANGGTAVNWNKVRAVLITAETYDARISVGTAAENDVTPVGHILSTGSSVRYVGNDMCKRLYIISKTDDEASALMVTVEY